MPHPYENLPATAFWRTAVSDHSPFEISTLWHPKYRLVRPHKVATFGSCFAQHFGRALQARRYTWFDAEPAPDMLDASAKAKNGYGLFSARTGNIYTVAALKQWVYWALGLEPPPEEVWEAKGRFFDPFRPTIEPGGFASPEELFRSREAVFAALRDVIAQANHFVFTLGLTESWISRDHGYTYAMCPGTVAGEFDPSRHEFKNPPFAEIHRDLMLAIEAMRKHNTGLCFLLTVSPVPLTATASGKHVLTATTYSKAVLRGVAGSLAEIHGSVDYFPSYEIITAPPFQGMFYDPNKRTIAQAGVDFVMDSFFACLRERFGDAPARPQQQPQSPPPRRVNASALPARNDDSVFCEEQMLAAFGPPASRAKADGKTGKPICIFGNSNIAAIKFAIREGLFKPNEWPVIFWGLPAPQFNTIWYKAGEFTSAHEDLARAISDYRYGTLPIRHFAAILFHGCDRLIWSYFDLRRDNTAIPTGLQLSDQIRRWLERDQMYRFARSVRADFAGPIFMSPAALRAEDSGEFAEVVVEEEEIRLINSEIEKILAEDAIEFIAQPQQTICNLKYTKNEFSMGLAGLSLNLLPRPGKGFDHYHMNGRYGALVLKEVFERLSGSLQMEHRAAADGRPFKAMPDDSRVA